MPLLLPSSRSFARATGGREGDRIPNDNDDDGDESNSNAKSNSSSPYAVPNAAAASVGGVDSDSRSADRLSQVVEEARKIEENHPGIARPFGSLSEEYVAADRSMEDPLERK
jgi:hypothetical protein